MDSPIRFNEEFVLKIHRKRGARIGAILAPRIAPDDVTFDEIMDILKRLGIDDAAVVGSMYHYRILFDSQEDLNLFKLSSNIHEEAVLNTGEILWRLND